MNNIGKLIEKLNRKHRDSVADLSDKRISWGALERNAERIFKEVIKEAEASGYREVLFIRSSKNTQLFEDEIYTNHNFVGLYSGQHPMDISSEKYKMGRKTGGLKVYSESGGCLVIGQLPNGGVTFSIRASVSELHNVDNPIKVIRIFNRPNDVQDSHIVKAVKSMLIFSEDTSYTRMYPFGKYVWELALKHKKDIFIMLSGAFLGAILGLLFSWLMTKSQFIPCSVAPKPVIQAESALSDNSLAYLLGLR